MEFRHRKHLKDLKRTRFGMQRDAGGLYLDRNERAVAFEADILCELHKRLQGVSLNLYLPDSMSKCNT
jgi:hypothetical protein